MATSTRGGLANGGDGTKVGLTEGAERCNGLASEGGGRGGITESGNGAGNGLSGGGISGGLMDANEKGNG